MDDEAFARMLQQQLLDEDRMLMEQERQQMLQKHQPPDSDAYHQQPNLHDIGLPVSPGFANQYQHEQQQHNQQHTEYDRFDSQSCARILQQSGFDKKEDSMDGAIRQAAPPSGYRIGGGGESSPPSRPVPRQPEPPPPPPAADDFLDSDAELARRMQELESMGWGDDIGESFGPPEPSTASVNHYNSGSSNLDGDDNNTNNNSSDNNALEGRDWRREQEEEDARLARLLADRGGSFRELYEPEIPPNPHEAEAPFQGDIVPPSSRTTSYQQDDPRFAQDAGILQSEVFVADSRIRNEHVGRTATYESSVPLYSVNEEPGGRRGNPSVGHCGDGSPFYDSQIPPHAAASHPMSERRAPQSQSRHHADSFSPYESYPSSDVAAFPPEMPGMPGLKPAPTPATDSESNRQRNSYGTPQSDYPQSASREASQELKPPQEWSPGFPPARHPTQLQVQPSHRIDSLTNTGVASSALNATATATHDSVSNSPMIPTVRDTGLPRNGATSPYRGRYDPSPLDRGPLQESSNSGPLALPLRGGHDGSADPNPLDVGPLQGTSMPWRPLAVATASKVSTGGFVGDSYPVLPGDALLDVPSPTKKERKKKGGIMGKFFGGRSSGNDGKETVTAKSPPPPSKPKTVPDAASPREVVSRSGGGGGRRFQMLRPTNTNNVIAEPSVFEPGSPTFNQRDNTGHSTAGRFPIPPPVPRPADTIGAARGPLPYSLSVSREAPALPEATVGRKPHLSLTRSSATCAVCGRVAQNSLSALGKKYHAECFRCITCHERIDASGSFAFLETDGDKQPMHRKCYAEIFGIKCAVCLQSIPAGPDGKVSFVKHPFFETEQMCPRHARNMTRRCTGCHRFEPENQPFADLNDAGRCVCLACCRSVVVDSQDAQPLWEKVVAFFEHRLKMPIWKDFREVPILVVGYDALNDQIRNSSNVHGDSSQIMTRGLCLTEHQSGRRVRMSRQRFDHSQGSFVASDAEDRGFTFFQVPDASKVNPDASVTAILCLSGLPGDLVASVLAHEATHAWIKMHPRFNFERPIPPQVEEGCAQLIAHLFLNEGLDPPEPLDNSDGTGPSDEKLRQYFKFSIETDDHEIYGTGYRRAALAYSNIGIEALMSHVVLYQSFPET